MRKNEKTIGIKCVVRCKKCNNEQGIMSMFAYSYKDFPNYSRKQFYELADTDYDNFEKLIKESLSCTCEKCGEIMHIIEVLDMQYVD